MGSLFMIAINSLHSNESIDLLTVHVHYFTSVSFTCIGMMLLYVFEEGNDTLHFCW
jgi:hypothetical protein